MDSDLSLARIIELMQLDYNIPIEYLGREVKEYDRTLQIEWHPASGNKFKIEKLIIGEQEISFISAIGKYEDMLGQARAIINGTLLPREYRVFNKTVDVLFFEQSGRVYCVLEVNPSQEGRIKSVLFGQGYKHRREEWGKLQSKDLPQYQLDSRFFYWLFSKRGQKINIKPNGTAPYSINLIDVHAVSQLSERQAHDNRSEGAGVLGSISALSGLGSNQSVYEGGFHFLLPDLQLLTRIASNCTCFLDSSRSIFTGEEDSSKSIMDDFPKTAIIIYTVLFPGLLARYHAEVQTGNWSASREEEQRKAWALQVIKELAEDNKISLVDLETILS